MIKEKICHQRKMNNLCDTTVECPMCFEKFSSNFIEIHAQQCKGKEAGNINVSSLDYMPLAKKSKITKNQIFISQKLKSESTRKMFSGASGKSSTNIISENTKRDSTKFSSSVKSKNSDFIPFAERCRPCTLDEYVGQTQILGQGCVIAELLKKDKVPSMILWGPPGCGKTSLAHVIATRAKADPKSSTRFVKLSATSSGKADVQAAVDAAKNDRRMFQRKTILFIDEIHRFNKLQQDSFLPHVENGTITLIGATTENPSFSLNSALLSRCRVIILNKLSTAEVKKIIVSSLQKIDDNIKILWNSESTVDVATKTKSDADNEELSVSEDAIDFLAGVCDGDARTALNGMQMAVQACRSVKGLDNKKKCEIDIECVKNNLQRTHILYDRTGDQHYEMISAFHKSIRGCDDNATLYWLARMLRGGEDPKFIARRLIRIASEDIGIADSNALNLAVSAQQACQFIGMPECDVVLAHCAVYMARAPKSAEIYLAYSKAKEAINNHDGPLPGVPLHLRNASTKLMKELGYGKGYRYDSPSNQTYMPESIKTHNFFES